jgi:isoquinoline 1-oxidoreductase
MRPDDLSRRGFLATQTGLFVYFWANPLTGQAPAGRPARAGYPADFNAYLRIGGDNRVACFFGKVELGQGATTSLAQCLAEELDVAYDSVDVLMADTDLCPWDGGTGGSTTSPQYSPLVRAAAAEARAVLLRMASEQLQAPVERLQVKAGTVTDPTQNKQVTYGQLVQGQRIERHIEKVPLKAAPFTTLGQSPRRKDALEKVTGKAKYAGDFVLPGMLCARIVRPPAHGATLKNVDTSAAEKAGARVVRDGDLIAVLHERWDVADQALRLVKAQFELPPPVPDDKTIFDHLLKTAPPPRLVNETGNLAEGEKLAETIVEATYLNSYVAHAPMETHSALATFEGGKLTMWASIQGPFFNKPIVAQALGLPPEDVRIIAPYIGGSYGGKSQTTGTLHVLQAARLAKAVGKPIQVVWDRDEEFFWDNFRPAAVVKIRSGLTGAGKVIFWDFLVYAAGDRDAKTLYDFPHQRTASAGGWQGGNPPGMHPVIIGPWRGPSVNTNAFARESHMDMLASKAGVDPLEFRLRHLTDLRMRRVLEAVAAQFGWKPAKAPSGRGFGVACAAYKGESRLATMAEVAVDKRTGHVQVKRVSCAMDVGMVLNPDGLRQQIEGGITMSMGYALSEEIHFQGGRVLDRNFDTYPLPRFSWIPTIDTILIDNPSTPPTGAGEPPANTTGALLANAIFDAVGARLFQLPMTPERVKEAIQQA